MILTRTPLRISIGGGGTDLPSYYRRRGGSVISAAIDKYVYLAVNATFTDDYLLKYSMQERVDRIGDIAARARSARRCAATTSRPASRS